MSDQPAGEVVKLERGDTSIVCLGCTLVACDVSRPDGGICLTLGSLCKKCGGKTIQIRTRELDTLSAWFAVVYAHGYDSSTTGRAAAENFAARAVVGRMEHVVAAMRTAGLEPDGRAAAELTRLVWDVEDSILEAAERATKKKPR